MLFYKIVVLFYEIVVLFYEIVVLFYEIVLFSEIVVFFYKLLCCSMKLLCYICNKMHCVIFQKRETLGSENLNFIKLESNLRNYFQIIRPTTK